MMISMVEVGSILLEKNKPDTNKKAKEISDKLFEQVIKDARKDNLDFAQIGGLIGMCLKEEFDDKLTDEAKLAITIDTAFYIAAKYGEKDASEFFIATCGLAFYTPDELQNLKETVERAEEGKLNDLPNEG